MKRRDLKLIGLLPAALLAPVVGVLLFRLGAAAGVLWVAALLTPPVALLLYGALRAFQLGFPGQLKRAARPAVVGENLRYQPRPGRLEALVRPDLGLAVAVTTTVAVGLLVLLELVPGAALVRVDLWLWGAEVALSGATALVLSLLVAGGWTLLGVLIVGGRELTNRLAARRLGNLMAARARRPARRYRKLHKLEERCREIHEKLQSKGGREYRRRLAELLELGAENVDFDETGLCNIIERYCASLETELRELEQCEKAYDEVCAVGEAQRKRPFGMAHMKLNNNLQGAAKHLHNKDWRTYRKALKHIQQRFKTDCREEGEGDENSGNGKGKQGKAELDCELSPREIYAHLEQHVIGQEAAKRAVSVAVANHLRRIRYRGETELEKSNILLVGPTGCGKTHLVKSLARLLKTPLVISEATSLTETGYIGRSVEDLLYDLYVAAGRDLETARYGIVYIDEIDKLAASADKGRRDVGGLGVQQALLTLVEGSEARFPESGSMFYHRKFATLDTRHVLFICGGAFCELDELRRYEQRTSRLGFGASTEEPAAPPALRPAHLIEFGLLPEFVGRFPVVCELDELTDTDLARVIAEPKNALVKQHQALMASREVELEFTAGALTTLAALARAKGLGARGARGLLDRLLEPYYFDLESYRDQRISITAETVQKLEQPIPAGI
jgi:ATP-dependent Clp protease ATP-binding subunit ClpX